MVAVMEAYLETSNTAEPPQGTSSPVSTDGTPLARSWAATAAPTSTGLTGLPMLSVRVSVSVRETPASDAQNTGEPGVVHSTLPLGPIRKPLPGPGLGLAE